LGKPSVETVAEIRGFFRAFEWVNHKTNHGYSFEISTADPTGDLTKDVNAHLSAFSPTSLVVQPYNDWRQTLFDSLKRWLLSYLRDHPSIGRLTDKSNTFSLSSRSFHKDMIDPLIAKIESLGAITSGHNIVVETDGFYACDYTDIVLETSELLIFLHFDVCD